MAADKIDIHEPTVDPSIGGGPELDDADKALAEMGYKPVSFSLYMMSPVRAGRM